MSSLNSSVSTSAGRRSIIRKQRLRGQGNRRVRSSLLSNSESSLLDFGASESVSQGSETTRLHGVYQQLLALADTGIVPPLGEMTEALQHVGIQVHSQAEVAAFVEVVRNASEGTPPNLEEFLDIVRQAQTEQLLAQASPLDNELTSVPPDAIPSMTSQPGSVSSTVPRLEVATLQRHEASFPSSPLPLVQAVKPAKASQQQSGTSGGGSLFNSPETSPRTQISKVEPQRGSAGQLSILEELGALGSRTPSLLGSGISSERSTLEESALAQQRESLLVDDPGSVSTTARSAPEPVQPGQPRQHDSLAEPPHDDQSSEGGELVDELELRTDVTEALELVRELTILVPNKFCQDLCSRLQTTLQTAMQHVALHEVRMAAINKLIEEGRKHAEAGFHSAVEQLGQHEAQTMAVREEAAQHKADLVAVRKQLTVAETESQRVNAKAASFEKKASEADRIASQLMRDHRRHSARQESSTADLETQIEQLEKENQQLQGRVREECEQRTRYEAELKAEQRARACTLIRKIAEGKHHLDWHRQQLSEQRTELLQASQNCSLQEQAASTIAMCFLRTRLSWWRREGRELREEVAERDAEREERKCQIAALMEEKGRLAEKNSSLEVEVDQLSANLRELMALDSSCRKWRLSQREHRCMLQWTDDENLDPLQMGFFSAVGTPSPHHGKDLMQELQESNKWAELKPAGFRLAEEDESHEVDPGPPKRQAAVVAAAAATTLKCSYVAESIELARLEVLSRALLALRLACGGWNGSRQSWTKRQNEALLRRALLSFRAAAQKMREERRSEALAEQLVAAACYARFSRRRRRGHRLGQGCAATSGALGNMVACPSAPGLVHHRSFAY